MVVYNFKKIAVVPKGPEFIDIVLTRTQRRTPTVVHPGYAISRIRKFYMRKVKYTAQTVNEKISQILNDFPVMDDIHPFYADLMNVLYDKDHYKLALGQLNLARRLVDTVAKDYVRLLKFGDSLYRCKQLKRAALGRMMKVLKKNALSFSYLEEVRQHLARLPSIDPNTRTIIICGYPNVGKSSFLNKLTRAEVDVQPYAFTTKSLFVGHMDYKFLRWQMIDTPGILDHPLDERNTIEMQSITALAHLRATILYFIDISEQCGYTIEQQCSLCESIQPLFANKPVVIVMNKVDIMRPEELPDADRKRIAALAKADNVTLLPMSSISEEGINEVKTTACDALLEQRTQLKLKGKRIHDVINRLHLAQPVARDDVERPPVKPEVNAMETDVAKTREELWRLQQLLHENMDLDYKGVDFRDRYLLDDPEWRFDTVPEIMDGHNLFDFWSPDIEQKFQELEREELALLRRLEMEPNAGDKIPKLTPEEMEKVFLIREKKALLIQQQRINKGNKSRIPLKYNTNRRSLKDMSEHFTKLGLVGDDIAERVRARSVSRSKSRMVKRSKSQEIVSASRARSASRSGRKRTREELDSRGLSTSRAPTPGSGFKDERHKNQADRIAKRVRLARAHLSLQGESDRRHFDEKPKHLYSGKMTIGKRDRR